MARVRVRIPDDEQKAEPPAQAAKSEQLAQNRGRSIQKIIDNNLPKLIFGALLLFLLVGLIVVINDRNQLKGKVDQLNVPTQAQDETQQLVNHLSQFMELPTDEEPTLATVSNVEELQSQVFFKNAQNNDKVLLYAKSGKAILYRPSTKKVIEVSALATGSAQPNGNTNQPR